MNFGINPYEVSVTLLSPVVAMVFWRQKEISVVVAITFGCAFASWLLMFASEAWIDQQWAALIENTPNPSVELIREADSDGASKTATLLFGLPVSLVYFLFCFSVVRSGKWLWEKIRNSGRRPPEARR